MPAVCSESYSGGLFSPLVELRVFSGLRMNMSNPDLGILVVESVQNPCSPQCLTCVMYQIKDEKQTIRKYNGRLEVHFTYQFRQEFSPDGSNLVQNYQAQHTSRLQTSIIFANGLFLILYLYIICKVRCALFLRTIIRCHSHKLLWAYINIHTYINTITNRCETFLLLTTAALIYPVSISDLFPDIYQYQINHTE